MAVLFNLVRERGLGHVSRPQNFQTISTANNLKGFPQTATGSFRLHAPG